MKVLVTGVCGQLGHDVVNELYKRGHEVTGTDIQEHYCGVDDGSAVTSAQYVPLDITDEGAVKRTIANLHPDAVIHCAGWTAVDAAEDMPGEADKINHLGTKYIAEGAAQADAKLLYISTDYVFDGKGERPWMSDSADFAPLNVYGATKLAGEEAVRQTLKKYFIVRISWAFGLNGKNFVRTMINIGKTHKSVRVVNDQIGTPTYTRDLARLLGDMIETEKYGCYHATNEGGYISWCDFCREIYRQCGLNTEVIPVSTEEYGLSRAARPQNSRLDKSKLALNGFAPLPDWRDALSRYLEEAKL